MKMPFFKKKNLRRDQVRKNIASQRLSQISQLIKPHLVNSALLWLLFVVLCIFIMSFKSGNEGFFQLLPTAVVTILISIAAAFYICCYQQRILKNHTRAFALEGLFLLLLATVRAGTFFTTHPALATGTAVAAAVILAVAYDQRFAFGMSFFYCVFAFFAAGEQSELALFFIMTAGIFTCCFSLKEIRTRTKLLEVSVLTASIVFLTAAALLSISDPPAPPVLLKSSGLHAVAALCGVLAIHILLPLIEKAFKIATSMTLLTYSDANYELLKRLAMEAPGTFSHVLLVGAISEAAAEAIGRNGLLCRVGAYYHDIGKLNKPTYFVENELGAASKHKELSPAMSQLIIVGHVKDGIEMAKEYKLPAVLRQFIETHHGTTLVEYFYNRAKKQQSENGKANGVPSETEFRYTGPKPRSKEAAIVMLADASEGATRSLPEVTLSKIDAVVHNMAMKRLQDGQFDECNLSLRELSKIESAMSKALAAHYHSRIAYPTPPDQPPQTTAEESKT
jgi:hypothetical protein